MPNFEANKWVSIRGKLLTKGMIVRTKSVTNTATKDGVVTYSYGKVDFGNGLDPTHTGRGIFVDNATDNLVDTLAGKGTSEKWSRQWPMEFLEE